MTPVATHRAIRPVVASSCDFTLEPLEERRLFSTIDLVGRTVVVHGTDTRDLLMIQQMPNYNGRMAVEICAQSYVTCVSDGGFGITGPDRVFYRDEIDQITFDGGAGDDDVFCDRMKDEQVLVPVDVPLLLRGGDGNDVLIGGDGNDTIVGGPGEDWIDGGTISHPFYLFGDFWERVDRGIRDEFTTYKGGNHFGGQAGSDMLFGEDQPPKQAEAPQSSTQAESVSAAAPATAPIVTPLSMPSDANPLLKQDDQDLLG